jgi:hypothetical protein
MESLVSLLVIVAILQSVVFALLVLKIDSMKNRHLKKIRLDDVPSPQFWTSRKPAKKRQSEEEEVVDSVEYSKFAGFRLLFSDNPRKTVSEGGKKQ